jgi:hypothetical protein
MAPLDAALLAPPFKRFHVSLELAQQYHEIFVNRQKYTLQAQRPMMNGKVNWYVAYIGKDPATRIPRKLDPETIRHHINGDFTVGLYALNPDTQRSKWIAIDADYEFKESIRDLGTLQSELSKDGIDAALEQSRRGAHLWIFNESPLLASELRIYIYNLALRLGIAIKGGGIKVGLEVNPKQDAVAANEHGNGIRGPLGIHQRTKRRYWFNGAGQTPEQQLAYLLKLKRLGESQLKTLIEGMAMPEVYQPPPPIVIEPRREYQPGTREEFRILEYVRPRRKDSRNYWTQCPSCALAGGDKSRDNLSISIREPWKYKCWAGCSKYDIRAALGRPIELRPLTARKWS